MQQQNQGMKKPAILLPLWVGYALAVFCLLGEISLGIFFPEEIAKVPMTDFIKLSLVVLVLPGYIYWLVCIFKMHKVLDYMTEFSYPIKPGRAVGFHFIPFYNLYWIFKWPSEVAKFINVNAGTQKMKPSLAGSLILLSFIIGRIVSGGLMLIIIFLALKGMVRNIKELQNASSEFSAS